MGVYAQRDLQTGQQHRKGRSFPAFPVLSSQIRAQDDAVDVVVRQMMKIRSEFGEELFTAGLALLCGCGGRRVVAAEPVKGCLVSVEPQGLSSLQRHGELQFTVTMEATVLVDSPAPVCSAVQPKGTHGSSCHEIAARYRLSPRETEVLDLIARGRNAQFVREKLGISASTAKAHIYHIYRKLGVHGHQEVIDMVEGSVLPPLTDVR